VTERVEAEPEPEPPPEEEGRVEAGLLQATRTAPSPMQDARSRMEEGSSRLEALTISFFRNGKEI